MPRPIQIIAIALLASVWGMFADAQVPAIVRVLPPATPSGITDTNQHELNIWGEIVPLLWHGPYADLDVKVNGLQHDYETGVLNDSSLMHISRVFYNTDPTLEDKYDAWVAAYPKSYAARMARGIYLWNLAMEARGSDYIGKTSVESLTAMTAKLRRAWTDLKMSESLTAKPIVTFNAEMGIVRMMGDPQAAEKILALANHIDSKNFIVRYGYFNTLQTRWGGSLQKMVDYRETARNEGLNSAQLEPFDKLIANERDWLAKNTARQ